jgi:hypothetical protein
MFIRTFKDAAQYSTMGLLQDQIEMLRLNAQEYADALVTGQASIATHAAVDRTATDVQEILAEVYTGDLAACTVEPLVEALKTIDRDLLPDYAAANLNNAINMYVAVAQYDLDVA